MASGKVSVNGVELYYEKKGSGPHAIVCIPGVMGSTEELPSNLNISDLVRNSPLSLLIPEVMASQGHHRGSSQRTFIQLMLKMLKG